MFACDRIRESEQESFLSPCYLWTPRLLRQTPVDPFQQISELGRRDRHASIRLPLRNGRRPHKPASLQSFCEQTHALAIVPKYLDQSTTPAAEDEQMTIVRITFERLLNQHGQTIKAFTHIRVAARQPNLRATRKRDHRASPSRASANAATRTGETLSGRRRIRPLRRTRSITAGASCECLRGKL